MWLHNESPDTLHTVHCDILFILSFGAPVDIYALKILNLEFYLESDRFVLYF